MELKFYFLIVLFKFITCEVIVPSDFEKYCELHNNGLYECKNFKYLEDENTFQSNHYDSFQNQTWVKLSKFSMKNLPTNFFDIFTSLKYLTIKESNFELNQILNIRTNQKIERMWFNLTNIKKIPTNAFSKINTLNLLNFDSNSITSIENSFNSNTFPSWRTLRELSLCKNKLKKILESDLSHLTGLEKLFLENNEITEIKVNAFSELKELKKLWLNENNIEIIPQKLFENNIELETLSLSNNKIKVLHCLTFHNMKKLKNLYLAFNKITEINANTFRELKELKDLWINNNNIEKIPEKLFENMKNLQNLYLHFNEITEINVNAFSELKELKKLYINQNRIEVIPEKLFENNIKLETLSLAFNRIKFLHYFTFQNLNNLQILYLHDNDITNLNFGHIIKLKKLSTFGIRNNYIENFFDYDDSKNDSLSALTVFDISNNPKSKINTTCSKIKLNLIKSERLTYLNLSSTNLCEMSFDSIKFFPKLEKLYLSNNYLKEIYWQYNEAYGFKLKEIDLTGNNLKILNYRNEKLFHKNLKLKIWDNNWGCTHLKDFLDYFKYQGLDCYPPVNYKPKSNKSLERIECYEDEVNNKNEDTSDISSREYAIFWKAR